MRHSWKNALRLKGSNGSHRGRLYQFCRRCRLRRRLALNTKAVWAYKDDWNCPSGYFYRKKVPPCSG